MSKYLKNYTVDGQPVKWENFEWKRLEEQILEQQYKIAEHQMGGDTKALKLSQQRLIHNVGTVILAVKRVTSSTGAKTPGIDGVV
jgi:RNA-directed DNA polymerase